MDIEFVASVAVITPVPSQSRRLYMDALGLSNLSLRRSCDSVILPRSGSTTTGHQVGEVGLVG